LILYQQIEEVKEDRALSQEAKGLAEIKVPLFHLTE
jgi:hypothetical protein